MKKINMAFCGLKHGHIFSLYSLAKADEDIRVTGVWEDEEKYRKAAEGIITGKYYGSFEELLDDADVDVVAVGDAYGARGKEIIRVLRAGKHVLSDKPLCTNLAELEETERLCAENGLYVGCMLDLRFDPALRLAADTIKSGALGRIHAVNFTGQHPLSWGKRPEWYFEKGRHGGTFNDLSIHGIDAVRFIADPGSLRVVHAREWNAFAKEAPSFNDCAQLMCEYESGAGLIADVSYSAPDGSAFELPSYWRFSFWGENGMLECRLGGNEVLLALRNTAPRRISAPPVHTNCLTELKRALSGTPTEYPQQLLFDSARDCLTIQSAAQK